MTGESDGIGIRFRVRTLIPSKVLMSTTPASRDDQPPDDERRIYDEEEKELHVLPVPDLHQIITTPRDQASKTGL